VGDLLYASTTTALSKLADVATGSCLISGGVGVAPSWGACGSGANTALSTLASVAINTSLLPGVTNSIDAGSSTKTFQTGYFGTSVLTPLVDTISAGTLNIGTTNATAISLNKPTTVSATAPNSSNGASLLVTATTSSTTNPQRGLRVANTVSPGSASTQQFAGTENYLYSNSANASGAPLYGAIQGAEYGSTSQTSTVTGGYSYAKFSSTGTLASAIGASAQLLNSTTGTITSGQALRVYNPTNSGTITTNYGMYVESQTAGATDYGIYIQGADTNAIYVNAGSTYLGGGLSVIGTASASTSLTSPLVMVGDADGTASPTAGNIRGASGAGTDIVGANLTIDPGNGTGGGGSGALILRTAGATAGTVAVDAATSSNTSSGTTLTWSHTTGSGSNRFMLVGVSYDAGTISGVTYNAVSMTQVATGTNGTSKVAIYKLLNPASGRPRAGISPMLPQGIPGRAPRRRGRPR
jgi:hypothetical protein